MTSRQWAEISRAFDTPPGERTERQNLLATSGLCYKNRLYWPHCFCLGSDTLRASLAALFAAMSQRERDEVLGRGF